MEMAGKFPVVTITGPRQSGKTIKDDFFKGLTYFENISSEYTVEKYIVYGGDTSRKQYETKILSWDKVKNITN